MCIIHLIITSRYSHFVGEETKGQRSYITSPGSQSCLVNRGAGIQRDPCPDSRASALLMVSGPSRGMEERRFLFQGQQIRWGECHEACETICRTVCMHSVLGERAAGFTAFS